MFEQSLLEMLIFFWSFHHSCHEMLVRLGFVHEHSTMRRSSGMRQITVSNFCGTEGEGGRRRGGTEANLVLVVLLGRRFWRPNKWEARHVGAATAISHHLSKRRPLECFIVPRATHT